MSAGDWKEMYQAACNGDLSLVKFHISSGVDPNYQHPEILSLPLVGAILSGHSDVALFLLSNGADPRLESHFDGLTPLQAAQKMKNDQVLDFIIKKLQQTKS